VPINDIRGEIKLKREEERRSDIHINKTLEI
jgi:hypothetical protein